MVTLKEYKCITVEFAKIIINPDNTMVKGGGKFCMLVSKWRERMHRCNCPSVLYAKEIISRGGGHLNQHCKNLLKGAWCNALNYVAILPIFDLGGPQP